MKLRIGVIYGGRSGEHEISLQSAASVIKNFDQTQYELLPIAIDKQGQWWLNELDDIFTDDQNSLKVNTANTTQLSESQLHDPKARLFDVAFPMLHGPLYEDGALQGMFELFEIPYVGCDVRSSAIAMDKVLTKQLAQLAKVPVLPWEELRKPEWLRDADHCCEELIAAIQFPVFVKSVSSGSSVGMHKVKTPAELKPAIDDVFRYDTKLLVERAIEADEIELAALSNLDYLQPPLISLPGEVKVSKHHEYYSYEAKYLDPNGAELLIPAPLNEADSALAQSIAHDTFIALDCNGLARIDLLRDRHSGKFYLNEVNPLPGFTKISMYPRLCQASGIEYKALLSHLVQLATARQKRRQALLREWEPAASDGKHG